MTEQKGSSSHVPEPSGAVSALDCSLADLYFERKKNNPFFSLKVTGIWTLCFMYLKLILINVQKEKTGKKPKVMGHRRMKPKGQRRSNYQVRD